MHGVYGEGNKEVWCNPGSQLGQLLIIVKREPGSLAVSRHLCHWLQSQGRSGLFHHHVQASFGLLLADR